MQNVCTQIFTWFFKKILKIKAVNDKDTKYIRFTIHGIIYIFPDWPIWEENNHICIYMCTHTHTHQEREKS